MNPSPSSRATRRAARTARASPSVTTISFFFTLRRRLPSPTASSRPHSAPAHRPFSRPAAGKYYHGHGAAATRQVRKPVDDVIADRLYLHTGRGYAWATQPTGNKGGLSVVEPIVGKVRFGGAMAFAGAANSGHVVRMDAAPEVGGEDGGPRPMELILLGLGGCTGMDVISILRKMRQDVTGYEILLHGERAENHPRVFTAITVEHVVRGRGLSDEAVRKAVELSETRYCPASAMLGKAASIKHTYRIVEQ